MGPPPGIERINQRLVGVWVRQNPESEAAIVLHVRSDKAGGLSGNVLYSEPKEKKLGVLWWQGRAYATKIGGDIYLNFRRSKGLGDDYTAAGHEPGYVIAKIRFDAGGVLWMRFMDPQALGRLVKEGRLARKNLKGSNRTGKVPYDYFTATTQQIRRLLKEVGSATLFQKEEGGFRRVPSVPTVPPK